MTTTARDAAIDSVAKNRRRGRPRRYDGEVVIKVDADLDRRVRSFAEVEEISISEAWRILATIALNEMEVARNR